ncbi:MAG TPA: hypothetical protein VG755_00210 [Nannocystaceae bacterium]|nr:hypothetical protein [Nannocystaceae bacterium]
MHFFELAEYLHLFRGGTPELEQPHRGGLLAIALTGLFVAFALLVVA